MAAAGRKSSKKRKLMETEQKQKENVSKKTKSGGAADNPKQTSRTARKVPAKKADVPVIGVFVDDTINELESGKLPSEKARMSKTATMTVITKEGSQLHSSEELGETQTALKRKPKNARTRYTANDDKTLKEAKALFGSFTTGERRTLRKRPPQSQDKSVKASLKKAGRVQKISKEVKVILKRVHPKENKKTK